MTDSYDVVVIGSGVAGALTASRLAKAGIRVLILEAGDRPSDGPAQRQRMADLYATSSSKSQGSPYEYYVAPQPNSQFAGRDYFVESDPTPTTDLLTSYYERLVGGTTWHWQGIALRMLPSDFAMKTTYGVGRNWPIGYDELEPWYCDAEREIGVAGDDAELDGMLGAFRSKRFPMPATAPVYMDLKYKEALKDAKFDIDGRGTQLPIVITRIPVARNSVDGYDGRPSCDGHSSCIPLCPTRAKYEAVFHIEKAEAAGAQLRKQAIVKTLDCDSSGRITTVNYIGWDGTAHSVTGSIVVLAAHAIESAKILLSSTAQSVVGLANSSGQVGLNLMDHPIKMSYGLAKDPIFPYRGPPSTSTIDSLRDGAFRRTQAAFRTTLRADGWTWPTGFPRGTNLKSKGSVLDLVVNKRMFGSALRDELHRTGIRHMVLTSATEMLPDAKNRVFLSKQTDQYGIARPQIEFAVSDAYSLAGLKAISRLHTQIFGAMGDPNPTLQDTGKMDAGSGHIMGTTIMGMSAVDSVVDRDCRSFDHPNLFILGSSVFPTSATANPTLTIAALALRAAQTIKDQLVLQGSAAASL